MALQDIFDEILTLFPSRYIHVGGDEARKTNWEKCPLCQKRMKKQHLTNEGRQLELVQAIHATGTPVVIIIVNGKPLNNEWITKNIPTIVDVWEPGMYGGVWKICNSTD